ncbi:MAG TPA: hypothetical protein VMJ33_11650 [Gallionella sp.]|nr:hypothetical protein [Gallionella sp.]
MDGKKLVLLGILVIAAGAAFVYFDPLDMDLLGLKKVTTVAKPATPHVASKAVAPPPVKAPVTVPSPAIPAAPKPSIVSDGAKAPAVPVTPAPAEAAEPAAASMPVAKPEQAPQPPLKLSKQAKAANKPAPDKARPKNLDLRFCLDLETNEAIAKCAGE